MSDTPDCNPLASARRGEARRAPGNATERSLLDLSNRPPGLVAEKISIASDGTIITSQGTLADLADLSKGAINRGLRALQQAGRIDFHTTNQETRIRIFGSERPATVPETPSATLKYAVERSERVVPKRS